MLVWEVAASYLTHTHRHKHIHSCPRTGAQAKRWGMLDGPESRPAFLGLEESERHPGHSFWPISGNAFCSPSSLSLLGPHREEPGRREVGGREGPLLTSSCVLATLSLPWLCSSAPALWVLFTSVVKVRLAWVLLLALLLMLYRRHPGPEQLFPFL